MKFDLVTPERMLVSETVDQVIVPGSEGSFGVLAGHQALISTLTPGLLKVLKSGQKDAFYALDYGFVDVKADKVTVLAEGAYAKDDIDVKETTDALGDVMKRLEATPHDDMLMKQKVCLEARLAVAAL